MKNDPLGVVDYCYLTSFSKGFELLGHSREKLLEYSLFLETSPFRLASISYLKKLNEQKPNLEKELGVSKEFLNSLFEEDNQNPEVVRTYAKLKHCRVCDYHIKASQWRQHVNSHFGLNYFECPGCGARISHDSLKKHRKRHEMEAKYGFSD